VAPLLHTRWHKHPPLPLQTRITKRDGIIRTLIQLLNQRVPPEQQQTVHELAQAAGERDGLQATNQQVRSVMVLLGSPFVAPAHTV
jgi:hypothetical protein